jgi:hypothetical protein
MGRIKKYSKSANENCSMKGVSKGKSGETEKEVGRCGRKKNLCILCVDQITSNLNVH